MSGHSKWATTHRQKAVVDAKRGAHFTKLSRGITIAAREGGGDPIHNMKLRIAIDLARASSMPKDNIERAIKRGTGELTGDTIEELTYEGFGPAGVALMIEVMTDNKNRSVNEIKNVLTKREGTLGGPGSVGWMFDRKGVVRVEVPEGKPVDELALIELGVEDIIEDGDHLLLLTASESLTKLERDLAAAGWKVTDAELAYWPKTPLAFPEGKAGEHLHELIDALDNLDDVVNVFTNAVS
ncbi:MAG: YebC/PmpR family DNA-binding transcriptional regulator [Patescibacteria group bacterium]|jgi:YebC/PmpR family DNA-binding regulatory protein